MKVVLAATAAALLLAPSGVASASGTYQKPNRISISDTITKRSELSVNGDAGRITDVDVVLDGLSHEYAGDVDLLLVSPAGKTAVLMSDACGDAVWEDRTLTIDDDTAEGMTPDNTEACEGDRHKPANFEAEPDEWAGAPAAPYGASLGVFDGDSPNGEWRLLVDDDDPEAKGEIARGWKLVLTTGGFDLKIPGDGLAGPASQYPSVRSTAGLPPMITDVDVVLDGLTHPYGSNLDMQLIAPSGRAVTLLSDVCGANAFDNAVIRLDDEAAPGPIQCAGGTFVPSTGGGGELPPPASPTAMKSLSALDFTEANGEWKLFVHDDSPAGSTSRGTTGFLERGWSVVVQGRERMLTGLVRPRVPALSRAMATVEVTRGPGQGVGPARVTYEVRPGSARAGSDFGPTPGFVDLAAGQPSALISIPLVRNSGSESAESFSVALTGATGDAAVDPARAVLPVAIPADPSAVGRRPRVRFRTSGRALRMILPPTIATGTRITARCVRKCGRRAVGRATAKRGKRTVLALRTRPRRGMAISVTFSRSGHRSVTHRYRVRR